MTFDTDIYCLPDCAIWDEVSIGENGVQNIKTVTA